TSNLPELFPRHLNIPYFSAYDPREQLRNLQHVLFVSSKFQSAPRPPVRVLKRHRCERANILDGDLLERFFRIERQRQRASQNLLAVKVSPILHKKSRTQNREAQPRLVNMLLDLPLALEVR